MDDRSGYVYLLKSEIPFAGCYKIGRTANPRRRLHDFGVKLPFETKPLLVVRTSDMYDLESALHECMGYRRVGGEWFQLNAAEVEYVKAAMMFAEADGAIERVAELRPIFAIGIDSRTFAAELKRWAAIMSRLADRFERRLNIAFVAREQVSAALRLENRAATT